MKHPVMRFALLIGLIALSATELGVPWRQAGGAHRDLVAPAEAAVSVACRVPVGGVPASDPVTPESAVATKSAGGAHAWAYAIPADRPQAPIGRFKLTAYSGPQLGQAMPITATGTAARAGRTVAVDPRVIALGSRIYIEGLGERIAEDVGGAVKGNHIDVYVHSVDHAIQFGVQRRTVTVLEGPKKAG